MQSHFIIVFLNSTQVYLLEAMINVSDINLVVLFYHALILNAAFFPCWLSSPYRCSVFVLQPRQQLQVVKAHVCPWTECHFFVLHMPKVMDAIFHPARIERLMTADGEGKVLHKRGWGGNEMH